MILLRIYCLWMLVKKTLAKSWQLLMEFTGFWIQMGFSFPLHLARYYKRIYDISYSCIYSIISSKTPLFLYHAATFQASFVYGSQVNLLLGDNTFGDGFHYFFHTKVSTQSITKPRSSWTESLTRKGFVCY